MVRVVALLSFYDETPESLHRCVTSLRGLDGLAALDGAHHPYPDPQPRSRAECWDAITTAAHGTVPALSLQHPPAPWPSEVAKRTRLLDQGWGMRPDWYLVIDADEQMTHQGDWRPPLEDPAAWAAKVLHGHPAGHHQPHTRLHRAVRGTRVVGHHARYVTPTGRLLNTPTGDPPGTIDLSPHLHVTHHRDRTPHRAAAHDAYQQALGGREH